MAAGRGGQEQGEFRASQNAEAGFVKVGGICELRYQGSVSASIQVHSWEEQCVHTLAVKDRAL